MSETVSNSLPSYPEAIKTMNDAMRLASSRESFEIKKATLYVAGNAEKDVYVVAMRGTDRSFDKNDVLGIPVCLKSFIAKTNIYFEKAKDAIFNEIPVTSDIVFIGHSLGGMIAQQLAADVDINIRFNVKNLLTIGSPFVKVKGRICPFYRFADKADFIPWLGTSIVANLVTNKPVFKSNGYFGKPVKAHTDSYRDSDSWREYDCYGVHNGTHALVFIEES